MALGKQAKVLSRAQIGGVLGYIAKTRNYTRSTIFLCAAASASI